MKIRNVVNDIPGGWYGNNIGSFVNDADAGNVVVDLKQAHHAVKWLQKRHYQVISFFRSDDANGLGIAYKR